MPCSIILPKIMQIGSNALDILPETLRSLGCRYPCIITDQTMLTLGYVSKVQELLNHAGLTFGIFADTMPEPNDTSIMAGLASVKKQKYDCLIALGGGSAIDSAKAIALLASHGGNMRDYKVPYVVSELSMPVIAIPTTAGTGSEATKVTVISDTETEEKMLCMGSGLIPAAAIIDYQLTLSLPSRIAADTGIDALTHAIEAYVSRKANLFSDQQAIAAMRLIGPNLIKACQEPNNMPAKEAMMLGSTLAGIAFSNASVALIHGMSRPLGVHFHIPHGMSNAMLLPTITEYSLDGAAQKYAECAMFLGFVENIQDLDTAHHKLISKLIEINQILKVPSLTELGIQKSQFKSLLELMAQQAIASGSPNNNPKVPSEGDMVKLYESLWNETQ